MVDDRTELEELRRLEQLEMLSSQAGGATQTPTLGERIGRRFTKMGEAVEASQQPIGSEGWQSLPRTGFQVGGQALGIPADIVGEGISAAARYGNQLTGGAAGEMLGGAVSAIGQLPSYGGGTLGKELPQSIEYLKRQYEKLPASVQRDIEAGANIAGATMPFLKGGEKTVGALKQIPAGLKAKKTPIKASQQMRKAAGSKLQAAKESGATFKPEFVDDFLDTAAVEMRPKGQLTKLVTQGSDFDDFLEKTMMYKGRSLGIDDMAEFDSLLGDLAYSNLDNMGNVTSQGKKYLDMQKLLRSKVEDAMKVRNSKYVAGNKDALRLLDEGRKDWSRMLRMQDVERIIDNAELMPNPSTSISTGFRGMIRNDPKLRGFTALEKDAIRKAAATGKATDILKTVGSRLNPIGGGIMGGPAGYAAAEAASSTARAGATAAQLSKARMVQNLLSQPAAAQVSPEIAPALGTLLSQGVQAGVPVGAYIATQDRPINPLESVVFARGEQ